MSASWSPVRCVVTATIAVVLLLSGGTVGDGAPRASGLDRFALVPKLEAVASCDMVCPAHTHGTPGEARGKLTKILADLPEGRKSSLYICQWDQLETVKMFAPMVDKVVLDPFVYRSGVAPTSKDTVWPSLDHPVINQIRQLYLIAGGASLVGVVDLDGEEAIYPKRSPSFEEVEWMALALVGAGYKGIAWKGQAEAKPWAERLRKLESRLAACAGELGASALVDWATSQEGGACSTVASKKMLFVVLLDPRYLRPSLGTEGVAFPVDGDPVRGTVTLRLPAGAIVASGTRLCGTPLAVAAKDGLVHVNYRLHGAGDILILRLKGKDVTTGAGYLR